MNPAQKGHTEVGRPLITEAASGSGTGSRNSGLHPAADSIAWSWYAPPPPVASSLDLDLHVSPFATGWNRLLAQPAPIDAQETPLAMPAPRTVSVPIVRPRLEVRSFQFPEPVAAEATDPALGESLAANRRPRASWLAASVTRIKPPRDVIKLEDRLRYILQPTLESLLAERSLEFPFQPFPFQLEGAAFLFPRHAAILADEMGLGKTMQAVTALRLLLRRGEVSNILLVCPKPLVSNWQREFHQWAPEIPVLAIEGDQPKRAWQWALPDVPVRLANYELLCRDRELLQQHDESGQARLRFDLVVLDEAQRIKNRASATSEAVRSIARNRSWALTGTPVENSPEDLVGIFEFLVPGFLSPEMKPRRLGHTVSDYVLRRTKEQVLRDLPPKLFRDAELELTPEQRESYQLAEDEGVLRLEQMEQAITIQHVFELVLRLKQICNFDPATGSSAKLERLQADLEEVAHSGRKAIIFSQWVGTLERLAQHLQWLNPLQYHGQVPAGRRDAVIRRFREDRDCHALLISYGAGGVGLNLQFADYVFLFDRWWNPAVEDQAINRAHRIGVAGPVTVSRFLTLQTIEERIERILQEKRDLFDTIFSEAEAPQHVGLTQAEIFGLFRLKCPGGPIKLAA